jgi:hypothetical protein
MPVLFSWVDLRQCHWGIMPLALTMFCQRVDVPVIPVVYQYKLSYAACTLFPTIKRHSLI